MPSTRGPQEAGCEHRPASPQDNHGLTRTGKCGRWRLLIRKALWLGHIHGEARSVRRAISSKRRPADRPEPQLYATIRSSGGRVASVKDGLPGTTSICSRSAEPGVRWLRRAIFIRLTASYVCADASVDLDILQNCPCIRLDWRVASLEVSLLLGMGDVVRGVPPSHVAFTN